jgi:hypothetical protein
MERICPDECGLVRIEQCAPVNLNSWLVLTPRGLRANTANPEVTPKRV